MPHPFSPSLDICPDVRAQVEALLRAPSTPQGLVFRCRIVLRCGDPDMPSNLQVGNELDCHRHTVGRWRGRFLEFGLEGLQDAPRSGRPRTFSP